MNYLFTRFYIRKEKKRKNEIFENIIINNNYINIIKRLL